MLSAREWSFALTPCSLALSGLPVSEASPVAGIGKSAAAIAPGSDVRMFVRCLLEQGRPPVVGVGCCNALFDAVVSKRLVVSSTPSD